MPPCSALSAFCASFGAVGAEQLADEGELAHAIDEAIRRKPKGHDFIIDRRHSGPAVSRHMSVTGG